MGTRFYPAGDLIGGQHIAFMQAIRRISATKRRLALYAGIVAVFNLQSRTGKSLDAVKTIRILQINMQGVKPFLAQFVEAKKGDLALISEQY